MENFIYSHPRSGRNWLRHRLLYFFQNILCQKIKDFDKIIHFTHIGFGDALLDQGSIEIERRRGKLKQTDNITILLRNNKAVMSSYHRYVSKLFPSAIIDLKLDLHDIHGFITSPLGISHYIEFMHTAKTILDENQIQSRIIYYEDAFDKRFISLIPEIGGADYQLTDNEIDKIFSNSITTPTKILGTINSYKDYLPEKSQDYIDQYTEDHCSLKSYTERYL